MSIREHPAVLVRQLSFVLDRIDHDGAQEAEVSLVDGLLHSRAPPDSHHSRLHLPDSVHLGGGEGRTLHHTEGSVAWRILDEPVLRRPTEQELRLRSARYYDSRSSSTFCCCCCRLQPPE